MPIVHDKTTETDKSLESLTYPDVCLRTVRNILAHLGAEVAGRPYTGVGNIQCIVKVLSNAKIACNRYNIYPYGTNDAIPELNGWGSIDID